MNQIPDEAGRGAADGRRRLIAAIRTSLRGLSIELSLLNRQVGSRLELRDADISCLDLIDRLGPLSPSALARLSGLHPATLTGILDRLERGGWIARERDAADRRAVLVRERRERNAELLGLYAGMNSALEQICARYSSDELRLLEDFLRHVTEAGQRAAAELAGGRD
jgi:DNA-binding MarR family transcriptional regulator